MQGAGCATLRPMIDVLLLSCGLVLAGIGTWRGYAAARSALGPLTHAGDATRALVEAGQPVHARPRIRLVAGRVLLAVGWLVLALYGLFLVSAGAVATA